MPLTQESLFPEHPLIPRFERPNERSYPLHRFEIEQLSLFPASYEELLRDCGVSSEELRGWRERGFLSFDPEPGGRYQTAHVAEVVFLNSILGLGLPDEAVHGLLGPLKKPYAYQPATTVYCFASGLWYGLDPLAEHSLAMCRWEFWRRIFREDSLENLKELRDSIDGRIWEIENTN